MRMREFRDISIEWFFCAYNKDAGSFLEFFKNHRLGDIYFLRIVKECCEKEGVRGIGPNLGMTTHGLRATTTILLLEAGNSDAAVSLGTGHRNRKSLRSYSTLGGNLG